MRQINRRAVQAAVALFGLTGSWASAATVTWSGAVNTAWSEPGNWVNGLPAGNDLVFDGTGAAGDALTLTNIVDAGVTAESLTYANLSPQFHHTQIATGVTLALTGAGNLLYVGTGVDNGSAAEVHASISGGGTLSLNNAAADLIIRQTSATSGGSKMATLDLSGLATLTATLGNLEVGVSTSASGGLGRAGGTLHLGNSNHLTASAILVSENPSSASGLASRINLGQINTVNAGSVVIGGRQGNGTLNYRGGIAGGTLVLRGQDGVGRTSLTIGAQPLSGGPNATSNGFVDLTSASSAGGSGSIDAMIDVLLLGRSGNSLSFGGNGTLTFDSGTINANSVIIGQQAPNAGGSNPTSRGTGTLNARGGALIVNGDLTLGMVKADFTHSAAAGATGTLNISNAAQVRVAGAVIDGTLASSVATGTSNITLNTGGTLRAGRLGAAGAPIEVFTIDGGTIGVDLGAAGAPATAWGHVDAFTANGANTIALNSAGGLSTGTFTALSFNALAGAGFSTFTLDKLPARVAATLVDGTNGAAAGTIGINVTAADQPRWDGNVAGGAWDINSTANWKLVHAGGATTYQEDLATYATTDSVLFNDDAVGTRLVNLAAALAPNGVVVDNSGGQYNFTGTGKITGATGLTKRGSGSLILENTGGNDFTGKIDIQGGSILASADHTLPSSAIIDVAMLASLNLSSSTQNVAQINLALSSNVVGFAGGSITAQSINARGGAISANIAGSTQINLIGDQSLHLSGDNTFTPAIEIPNGFSLTIGSNNALGTAESQTRLQGGAAGGTLYLSNNITTPENLFARGRQTNVNSTPHLANLSGDNTLSGQITMATGGGWYTIRADAGKLTLAGDIVNANTSARTLFLKGGAEGVMSGDYRDTSTGPGNLVKQDLGTWRLSGNNTYQGTTSVEAGQLIFEQTFISPSTLTVADGAQATLSAGGGTVLAFTTVALGGSGKLDLMDNKVMVRQMPVGTFTAGAYDGVTSAIVAGRGSAGGDAQWNGSGITTSDPRAVGTSNRTALGVIDASDKFRDGLGAPIAETDTATWAGQPVLGSDTLVMFTWGGDANLDGKINIDDYGRIDSNVGTPGASGWANGDFNYDGKINIDDYGIIDSNISNQGGVVFPTGSDLAGVTASAATHGIAAVPEPTGLALVALGSVSLLLRRRRQSN